MKRLSGRGIKWLKAFHLFFTCAWVGGALCLNVMGWLLGDAPEAARHGIDTARKCVDDFLIIPGAIGCLLTGLLYSTMTNWGWFKHHWITVKWIITVAGILFGTFYLGPRMNALPEMSAKPLETGDLYAQYTRDLLHYGSLLCATLVFAVFLSVLKPWGGKPVKRVD
jgi:uncharacterized membrane protein